jgi:hypothetical protein
MSYLALQADRKITVVDRGEELLVMDARTGYQLRYRVPKGEAKTVMVTGKTDMIVVDVATLEHRIEPKPIRVLPKRGERPRPERKPKPEKAKHKPAVCPHLGVQLVDEIFPPPDGLGDSISNGLSALGITKERWSQLVSLGKSEAGCGCNERQNLINWFGDKLGLPKGKGPELQRLLELTTIPTQSVHSCALYGKCLTKWRETPANQAIIEASGFHLCLNCEHNPANQKSEPT